MPAGSNLSQALEAFNLLRLLENEGMELFSMGEGSKSKPKLGGTIICEAGKVRDYFINPKVENEAFD